MSKYKIAFTGSAVVSADNEIEAERKFSNEDYSELQTDIQQIVSMEENEYSDLIKALRCVGSQDEFGACFMDRYNHTIRGKDGLLEMRCGNYEGSICCPFYQKKYGVCFGDGDCAEFLSEAANIIERIDFINSEIPDLLK